MNAALKEALPILTRGLNEEFYRMHADFARRDEDALMKYEALRAGAERRDEDARVKYEEQQTAIDALQGTIKMQGITLTALGQQCALTLAKQQETSQQQETTLLKLMEIKDGVNAILRQHNTLVTRCTALEEAQQALATQGEPSVLTADIVGTDQHMPNAVDDVDCPEVLPASLARISFHTHMERYSASPQGKEESPPASPTIPEAAVITDSHGGTPNSEKRREIVDRFLTLPPSLPRKSGGEESDEFSEEDEDPNEDSCQTLDGLQKQLDLIQRQIATGNSSDREANANTGKTLKRARSRRVSFIPSSETLAGGPQESSSPKVPPRALIQNKRSSTARKPRRVRPSNNNLRQTVSSLLATSTPAAGTKRKLSSTTAPDLQDSPDVLHLETSMPRPKNVKWDTKYSARSGKVINRFEALSSPTALVEASPAAPAEVESDTIVVAARGPITSLASLSSTSVTSSRLTEILPNEVPAAQGTRSSVPKSASSPPDSIEVPGTTGEVVQCVEVRPTVIITIQPPSPGDEADSANLKELHKKFNVKSGSKTEKTAPEVTPFSMPAVSQNILPMAVKNASSGHTPASPSFAPAQAPATAPALVAPTASRPARGRDRPKSTGNFVFWR